MGIGRQQLIYGWDLRQWRGDLLGGLTAAVVALPLALALIHRMYIAD